LTHALLQVGQLVVVETAIPAAVFVAVLVQLLRLDKRTDELGRCRKNTTPFWFNNPSAGAEPP
jgi:hypothetical protein